MRSAFLSFFLLTVCSAPLLHAQSEQKMFWALNQSGILIWDATASNGVINNGSGTWDLTTARWTRSKGAANIVYTQGLKPHFGGAPGTGAAGTISLTTPISAAALNFRAAASGNFTLIGSSIWGVGSTLPIDVASGISPRITSNLMGTNGLSKTGSGTLILDGLNDYEGATDLDAGTISCPDTTGWGALPSGAINVNAGTLDIEARYPYIGTCGNWALNGVNVTPFCYSGAMALTTNSANQTASAFYKTKIRTDGDFTASFVYYVLDDKDGDGMAFVIQNSAETAMGSNAGNCGSCLGYQGMSNSAAVLFNFFTGNAVGMQYATNGTFSYSGYGSVSPVVLNSGNAINITITYNYSAKTLAVSLAEQNTTHTYATTYTGVDIPAATGSPLAWVGFTAASGSAHTTQGVGNFTFSDRRWNVRVNASSTPNSTTSGTIALPSAPNLGGKIVNIVLNGFTTGFTWNAVTWPGTATGTPMLQLNGTTVTSGVASGGTTITYSATSGIKVTR